MVNAVVNRSLSLDYDKESEKESGEVSSEKESGEVSGDVIDIKPSLELTVVENDKLDDLQFAESENKNDKTAFYQQLVE